MTEADESHRATRAKSDARAQRPRDAATLVIVDRSPAATRILMGRRHAGQVFLPNTYVFPGGRVERADHFTPAADDLPASETAKLLLDMKGVRSASRARALALAALRETYEEAGLLIGARQEPRGPAVKGPWAGFLGHGFVPQLAGLTYFARAITPPGRPRRYDTRFFAVAATAIAHRIEIRDGELEDINWFTFDDARTLELPGITRVVVEDLDERLKTGLPGAANTLVPFYFVRNGSFERVLLSHAGCAP